MSIKYGRDSQLVWTGRTFKTWREFSVSWGRPFKVTYFTVAAGFVTDLASIPRAVRSLIPQVGRHLQAAVVHDWCYAGNTKLTRREADDLFYEGMTSLGVPWWKRQAMYTAVRMFGSSPWKGKT